MSKNSQDEIGAMGIIIMIMIMAVPILFLFYDEHKHEKAVSPYLLEPSRFLEGYDADIVVDVADALASGVNQDSELNRVKISSESARVLFADENRGTMVISAYMLHEDGYYFKSNFYLKGFDNVLTEIPGSLTPISKKDILNVLISTSRESLASTIL